MTDIPWFVISGKSKSLNNLRPIQTEDERIQWSRSIRRAREHFKSLDKEYQRSLSRPSSRTSSASRCSSGTRQSEGGIVRKKSSSTPSSRKNSLSGSDRFTETPDIIIVEKTPMRPKRNKDLQSAFKGISPNNDLNKTTTKIDPKVQQTIVKKSPIQANTPRTVDYGSRGFNQRRNVYSQNYTYNELPYSKRDLPGSCYSAQKSYSVESLQNHQETSARRPYTNELYTRSTSYESENQPQQRHYQNSTYGYRVTYHAPTGTPYEEHRTGRDRATVSNRSSREPVINAAKNRYSDPCYTRISNSRDVPHRTEEVTDKYNQEVQPMNYVSRYRWESSPEIRNSSPQETNYGHSVYQRGPITRAEFSYYPPLRKDSSQLRTRPSGVSYSDDLSPIRPTTPATTRAKSRNQASYQVGFVGKSEMHEGKWRSMPESESGERQSRERTRRITPARSPRCSTECNSRVTGITPKKCLCFNLTDWQTAHKEPLNEYTTRYSPGGARRSAAVVTSWQGPYMQQNQERDVLSNVSNAYLIKRRLILKQQQMAEQKVKMQVEETILNQLKYEQSRGNTTICKQIQDSNIKLGQLRRVLGQLERDCKDLQAKYDRALASR